MANKKNLIIKNKSAYALNEDKSQEGGSNGKYVFKGVFTQCSVPGEIHINRNNRIYQESEVLEHLGYLREKIRTDGAILGELDHPESRMDTSLKEVSHKITDLYYDDTTHCVMGKIELLDTPNGRIAKELVDAGMPIFVSSRAAGQADEKTHEVEIYQIFTYDIVCNPGFAEARLSRVNESKYPNAYQYLVESKKYSKSSSIINESKKYGFNDENTTIIETNEQLDENMAQTTYNKLDLEKPLLKEDENISADEKKKEAVGLSTPSLDPADVSKNEGSDKTPYTENDILNDATVPAKDEDRSGDILDIKVNDEESENSESKDRAGDILDIKSETEEPEKEKDSDDDKKDSEDKEEKDDKKDKKDKEDKEDKDDKDDKDVSECGDVQTDTSECAAKNAKDVEKQVANNDSLLKTLKKKASVKESIINAYPFTISLSESNFAKFANLNKEDKMKCMNFIVENKIYDIKSINDLWNTPLLMEKKLQNNWLKLADPEDIELFKKASLEEQNAIENSASFLILENKADVDEFWERTGLRQRKAQEILNEERMSKYNSMVNPVDYSADSLGYNYNVIKMVEDAMLQ